uniref:Nerve growth factor-related domain-containing protein n=1 Tax=Panagrolaimus sp. JU765 TaxID=591449 RepID=A0AC34QAW7_9BILA
MIRLALLLLIPGLVVQCVYVSLISRYDPFNFLSRTIPDPETEYPDQEQQIITEKRTAQNMKSLPAQEHVCSTLIKTDYRPQFGHEQNGSRQDERRHFRATFVECENTERTECHGIDNAIYTSECVTLYEFRPAGVRIVGAAGDFVDGLIRIPITCQCRLRRKFNRS